MRGRSIGIVACAIGLAASGAAVRADSASSASRATGDPYVLKLSALTGPQGADLTLELVAVEGYPAVNAFKSVQLKTYTADGKLDDVRKLANVRAPGGVANVDLGRLARDRRVEADVLVQSTPEPQARVLRASTRTRLRPDLVVAAVHAPAQSTTKRPIDVLAEIEELNGDTPATATVTLMLGPTRLAPPASISVAAGSRASIAFTGVTVATAALSELSVFVTDASPGETDTLNNVRTRTIDVTEHELVASNVLVPSLGGYGAQFNQHVYAPITSAPPSSFPAMEAKVKAFEPQLVRIFYNENWEEDQTHPRYAPENMPSFIRTVELAHEAGATINIAYHSVADARLAPGPHMDRFAAVLEDLVRTRGFTNVRWVTIGNEPNTPGVLLTLEQYEAVYRALHTRLVERGLREHVRIMGGDLVEGTVGAFSDHRNWFDYMAEHMNDIVDAYSVHIYWNYDNIPRMELRLRDVRAAVTGELPVEARKPTYIMEFAVRGKDPFPDRPTPRHAYYEDGTEMRKTNVAAFQTLWFFLGSAQLGYTGTAKWDAYWGMYDLSSPGNQSYWMTGTAAEGWPLYPTWHALRLLLATTERGWQVLQVAPWEEDDWKVGVPDQPEKELVAYGGGNGDLTVIGLDTHARFLNTVSESSPAYSIGGLPPSRTFNLALWNTTGNGENSTAGTVTTSAAGVARFAVPLHAAFALTTMPVS